MDKYFKVHKNYEKDGLFYIEIDYGILHTENKKEYDSVIENGFIIIKIDDYPSKI